MWGKSEKICVGAAANPVPCETELRGSCTCVAAQGSAGLGSYAPPSTPLLSKYTTDAGTILTFGLRCFTCAADVA